MELLVSVLLCWGLVAINYCQEITKVCDLDPPCKKVSTRNATLEQYVSDSPYYELITTYHEDSIESVGACVTFFTLDGSNYVVFRNVFTKDGGSVVQVYTSGNLPGQPGVYRQQGLYSKEGNSTTVFNAYLLDTSCATCSQLYMFYSCYLLGTPDYVYPVDEIAVALFTKSNPPTSCLDEYERLVDELGFSHSAGFARASGSLPPCVTRWNNNYCVNADRIKSANATSYP